MEENTREALLRWLGAQNIDVESCAERLDTVMASEAFQPLVEAYRAGRMERESFYEAVKRLLDDIV